jgi:hypothetical protein
MAELMAAILICSTRFAGNSIQSPTASYPCFSSDDRAVARFLKKGLDYFGEEISMMKIVSLFDLKPQS